MVSIRAGLAEADIATAHRYAEGSKQRAMKEAAN
jgi:hypothetical protein